MPLEPIALYHTKDLEPGDGAWAFALPPAGEAIDVGEVGVHGEGDVVVFTYGNGVPMSLRVARRLAAEGVRLRVVDLRWLAPLPEAAILWHACSARAVLVVDECRRSGNVSEGIAACLLESDAPRVPFARVTSADSFIPLADAANLVLASEAEILAAARKLAG